MNSALAGLLAVCAFLTTPVSLALRKKTTHPLPIRASFYASRFEGRLMANGKPYHAADICAASRQFPIGTRVKVTNVRTGRFLILSITDRGPWNTRFRLDLSPAAFASLGFSKRSGWGWVTVEKYEESQKGDL